LGGTYRSIYIDNIQVEQLFDNDLAVTKLTGSSSIVVGNPSSYSVQVQNKGLLTQNNYEVQLLVGETILSTYTVTGANLASDSTAVYQLTWNPSSTGTYSIYAKVILVGDAQPLNDISANMTVVVLKIHISQLPVIHKQLLQQVPTLYIIIGVTVSRKQYILLRKCK